MAISEVVSWRSKRRGYGRTAGSPRAVPWLIGLAMRQVGPPKKETSHALGQRRRSSPKHRDGPPSTTAPQGRHGDGRRSRVRKITVHRPGVSPGVAAGIPPEVGNSILEHRRRVGPLEEGEDVNVQTGRRAWQPSGRSRAGVPRTGHRLGAEKPEKKQGRFTQAVSAANRWTPRPIPRGSF